MATGGDAPGPIPPTVPGTNKTTPILPPPAVARAFGMERELNFLRVKSYILPKILNNDIQDAS